MRNKFLFFIFGFCSTALLAQVSIPIDDVEELKDSTTLGRNLLKLGNPNAVRYARINADNTVTLLDAAGFRGAIGAGDGTGTGDIKADGTVALAAPLPYTPYTITTETVLDVRKFTENEISANKTFTLSATPAANQPFPARIKNVGAGPITITLTPPGGYTFQSLEKNGPLTSFVMAAGQAYILMFNRVSSSIIEVTGVPGPLAWPEEVQLTHPHMVDGTGAAMNTTPTSLTYGQATFSGTASASANFVVYRFAVPVDFDPTVPLKAYLKINLGDSADTAGHRYILSMCDVGSSGSLLSPTFINPINIDLAADAAGGIGDQETSDWVTLTGWAEALTPRHSLLIKLARAGDDATNDPSNVSSTTENLIVLISHLQQ